MRCVESSFIFRPTLEISYERGVRTRNKPTRSIRCLAVWKKKEAYNPGCVSKRTRIRRRVGHAAANARISVTQRSTAQARSRQTVEGEYPIARWSSSSARKAQSGSYAPSVDRMKLGPSKALIETWFPLSAVEHTRFEDSTVVERSNYARPALWASRWTRAKTPPAQP